MQHLHLQGLCLPRAFSASSRYWAESSSSSLEVKKGFICVILELLNAALLGRLLQSARIIIAWSKLSYSSHDCENVGLWLFDGDLIIGRWRCTCTNGNMRPMNLSSFHSAVHGQVASSPSTKSARLGFSGAVEMQFAGFSDQIWVGLRSLLLRSMSNRI
jgi:hypothetical protein